VRVACTDFHSPFSGSPVQFFSDSPITRGCLTPPAIAARAEATAPRHGRFASWKVYRRTLNIRGSNLRVLLPASHSCNAPLIRAVLGRLAAGAGPLERLIMAKEELLQFEGLVVEALPDARFRVQLDAGHEIVAYTAGKMKRNRIKTLAGDRVTVEMSPYDLEKGRLIFRHKDERAGASRAPVRRTFVRR
jgi:translation initiation factor IF-1